MAFPENVTSVDRIIAMTSEVFPKSEGWSTNVVQLRKGEGEGTFVHTPRSGVLRRRCMDDREIVESYGLAFNVSGDEITDLIKGSVKANKPMALQEMLNGSLLQQVPTSDYYEGYASLGATYGDMAVRGAQSFSELSSTLSVLGARVGLGVHGDMNNPEHCGAFSLFTSRAITPIRPVSVDWRWISFLTLLKGGRFDVLAPKHTATDGVLNWIPGVTGLHSGISGGRHYVVDMDLVTSQVGAEPEGYMRMMKPAFEKLVTGRQIQLLVPSR